MKTKPGGRGARTDLPPEIPDELKALDDAALLDALETQPPAVATPRAARKTEKETSTLPDAASRVARASCSRESSSARPRRVRRRPPRPTGFPGPTARSCSSPAGALEKTSSTNAANARRREPWSRRTPTLINARSGPIRESRARERRRQDAEKCGRRVKTLRGRF